MEGRAGRFFPCHLFLLSIAIREQGSIVVRAHASHVEDLQFEPDLMPWLNAHSLFTQQRMGTQWEHWGDKGGDEGNWPPYLKCRWLSISVLSNRQSPTYKSIWEYLFLLPPGTKSLLGGHLVSTCLGSVFNCVARTEHQGHFIVSQGAPIHIPAVENLELLLITPYLYW